MTNNKYLWQTQRKVKITENDLIPKNTIIHKGYAYIEHPWFNDAKENLEADGRSVLVKYVIATGGIGDWVIYHSLCVSFVKESYLDNLDHINVDWEKIYKYGQKLYDVEQIKSIVDCSDEILKKYRF